jgi:hypothetical protein
MSTKNGMKTLIPTVCDLFFVFLSLKNDVPVNVPSKSNKQKNYFFKLVFCWRLEGQLTTGSESGTISQRHGFAKPDPYPNIIGPQHCN